MADWLMAGCNPARTAFQPTESLGANWSLAWKYAHQATAGQPVEKVYPLVQPIVSSGGVFVPTRMGRVRRFAAALTGPTIQWTRVLGPSMLTSGAADGTNYYQCNVNGELWALKLADGTNATGWATNPVQISGLGYPIQSHMLLADGKLIFGGTDGFLYARDPSNGGPVWTASVPAEILGGAAWSNATGTPTVVVGAQDGKLYAFNSTNGAPLWTTPMLNNSGGFQFYFPVIIGTTVLVRTSTRYPWFASGPAVYSTPIRGLIPANWDSVPSQQAIVDAYDANPNAYVKSMFLFHLATGAELPPPVQGYGEGYLTGVAPPPCVDRNGHIVMWGEQGGVNRLCTESLATRKPVTWLVDPVRPGLATGNVDESIGLSACANGIANVHTLEFGFGWCTFFNQDTGVHHNFQQPFVPVPLLINNQTGACPLVISNQMGFHVTGIHALTAFRTV